MKYYFRCPNCRNDTQFILAEQQSFVLGFLRLLFGGFFRALLVADCTHRRIQCKQCSRIFRQPRMPNSPLARFGIWILALALIPVAFSAFLFAAHKLAGWLPSVPGIVAFADYLHSLPGRVVSLLPSIPALAGLEKAIAAQPRLTAYLLALLFVLMVASSWVAACVSNLRLRMKFSREYRVKPPSSVEFAQQTTPPSPRVQPGSQAP